MKLWQKETPIDQQIETFTVGNDYILDFKLVPYDCLASQAHAKMLAKIGILTEEESARLVLELDKIAEQAKAGIFKILPEQEDCHTAIENRLVEKLGELGKKIHTARSRNDQVLTALRLYYKDALESCQESVTALSTSIERFVQKYGQIALPGYTHTRKAMPSSITMWGGAFVAAMQDNLSLVDASMNMIDQCPLGTAAGYGVPLEIDREFTASELGFGRVQENPVYAQLSRGKLEATMLHTQSQIMLDLNRFASDLIFFSMPEIGYFSLPTDLCTGSSIMPQKQNPDVLELVRAKYHSVFACEMQLRTTTANLISGYHRDLQLTKEPTMKGLEITNSSLAIVTLVFERLSVDETKCKEGLTEEVFATEEVYRLVAEGAPFREAYRRVAGRYKK